jgi:hypothetical protein
MSWSESSPYAHLYTRSSDLSVVVQLSPCLRGRLYGLPLRGRLYGLPLQEGLISLDPNSNRSQRGTRVCCTSVCMAGDVPAEIVID